MGQNHSDRSIEKRYTKIFLALSQKYPAPSDLCSDQNDWICGHLHLDLVAIKILSMSIFGFECYQPIMEAKSAEYGAYLFKLNDLSIEFRVAQITPTKRGTFLRDFSL